MSSALTAPAAAAVPTSEAKNYYTKISETERKNSNVAGIDSETSLMSESMASESTAIGEII